MNEQLQTALLEIITKVTKGVDASVDFLSAEIPDVVHQLLMWYAVKGAVLCMIGIAVVVVWVIAEMKVVKHLKAEQAARDVWFLGYGLLGSLARLVPFFSARTTINLDWLQIWIAPKIWLIEYVSSLAK
ncbi:MAG: hypothetical protein ACRC8I_11770 [Plesiomonas shigelloides]